MVICYIDENKNKTFTTAFDYDIWHEENPNCTAIHVFDDKMDILQRKDDMEVYFLNRCQSYGLLPDMLHKTFINEKNEECEILGMNPNNHKYKFIIKKLHNGKQYKVTNQYIKKSYKP